MKPAIGQVWLVGNERWFLRGWDKNFRGFRAAEVNGRRRALLTPEFLEDAKFVEYLYTPTFVEVEK